MIGERMSFKMSFTWLTTLNRTYVFYFLTLPTFDLCRFTLICHTVLILLFATQEESCFAIVIFLKVKIEYKVGI